MVVRRAEQGAGIPPRWNPYTMEIDWGRNYYACDTWPAIVEIGGKEEE